MPPPRPPRHRGGTGLLRPYLRAQRWALVGAGAASAAEVLVSLGEPWPLALAVDGALSASPRPAWASGEDPVWLLAAAAAATVLLTLLGGVLDAVAAGTAERAAERVGRSLRAAAVDRVLALSLRWHDRTASGEVLSRLTTDVGRVLDALVATVTTLVPDLLLCAGILGVLLAVDVPLALLGVVAVPPLAWLTRMQRRRVRGAELAAREAAGRLAGTAAELLRNVRAVQAFGRADLAGRLFGAVNDATYRARSRAVRTEARWTPVPAAVLAAGTGAVLLAGGLQVRSGRLSIGELLVVLSYLRDLHSPVRGLVRLAGLRAKSAVSLHRLAELLRCADVVPVPAVPARPGGDRPDLRLERVDFGYAADRRVLAGLDLTVAPGETVCLLGPSGSGKSTVLYLLLRLYDADAGRVLVGGVDVRDLDPLDLRRRIGFVPQDPWLLDGTLADNIAFGAAGATREDVLAAARAAGVDEFAGRLPRGYDTPLGEAGAMLSGGQRRRVAIARAVVARTPVLLLDEPTTSLDAVAAERVVAAVRTAGHGRTVLVVTHDPRLAAVADRIVRLAPLRPGPRRLPAVPDAPATRPIAPAESSGLPLVPGPDRVQVPAGPLVCEGG